MTVPRPSDLAVCAKHPGTPIRAWLFSGLAGLIACSVAATASGEDWPTCRHDIARSGITSERLQPPLAACWVFKSRFAPQPAWGDPRSQATEGILELRRNHFDDVFEVVVADGSLWFGSSADNKVYCLDAASGRIRWTVATGGPVRLAPSVVGGRLYVGSDDGYVRCLKAADGSLCWKFRAAPADRRVLGHGKMISLWPVRTGVLVDGGAAYFGAGVFPAEGVFLYAVDAATGREIWRNDACGEAPQSWVSPQGYLLASSTTLYAPMGRVSPAAVDRATGKVRLLPYFGKTVGGTYALLADDGVYTGTEEMVAYRGEARDRFAAFAGRKLLITKGTAYLAGESRLSALDRKTYPATSLKLSRLRAQAEQMRLDPARRKQRQAKGPDEDELRVAQELKRTEAELAKTSQWSVACQCSESLILAGDVLFAGGQDQVIAIAADSGKTLWTGQVDGLAKGLAAAGGRLLVSTDKGWIYSFGPEGPAQGPAVIEPAVADPYAGATPAGSVSPAKAAERILKESRVSRGYCLVLGCETGQLAYELAKRSELMIYAVTDDPKKQAGIEKRLDRSGLLGARICVEAWPLDKIPYSEHFANLIVSETAVLGGPLPPDPAELIRMLKPSGGVALLGPRARRTEGATSQGALSGEQWLAQANLPDAKRIKSDEGTWIKIVRGPLPGAGSWTHEYANAANTACGDDQLVKHPLSVLWFGDPGPGKMLNRHDRAAGPLSIDGRLFIQGQNVVMAYDAYNGLLLWERNIPGAARPNASHDGGNLALDRSGLFVAAGDKCLRLDPATGETAKKYEMPVAASGKRGRWGYVACSGKLLYGSRSLSGIQSDAVFALDAATGQTRWVHQGRQILHNCIAIGDGRVFLIDNDSAAASGEKATSKIGRSVPGAAARRGKADAAEGPDVRTVVALDTQTGHVCWKKRLDLSQCGAGNLAVMCDRGVLVIFGVYLDGHYWKQFFAGEFASRRVVAMSAKDGQVLWSKPVGFRVRPVIIGDTLYAEPWAFDLRTGDDKTRIHPVTGQADRWQFARPGHHCGCPCAAPNALFFRSHCLGYYDLASDSGTYHFGAQRPGCWINFIPANGLLLVPEASSGCMCPFPNMCTVVFQPAQRPSSYALYSAPGSLTPVRRLAVNLGAGGDRKDSAGNLWLAYPRPGGSLVLQLKMGVSFVSGGAFLQRNSSFTPVSGTEEPWLFAAAARGISKCVIPLMEPADGTAVYAVRLGFADPDNDQPGQRVFDVKLQGKTVLSGFDIAKEAGGRDRAVVKQFEGIPVTSELLVEFVPRKARPELTQAPILQCIEIIRQRVLSLGCTESSLLLSNAAPKQTSQLHLSNLRDEPFEGTLQLGAVHGFDTSPKQANVVVQAGGRATIAVEVTAAPAAKPGRYEIPVTLAKADGSIELRRTIHVEHLGRRGRIAVPPVEDAYVSHRYPTLNKGSATVLLVDGGDRKMGDADHNLAYLKFRFDVPGKPVSARLRIRNAGNPTGHSGRILLVTEPWTEEGVTYANRPKTGPELASIGPVAEDEWIDRRLDIDLTGKKELSLLLDPINCDGVDYLSRESSDPPQLVIEYEPAE